MPGCVLIVEDDVELAENMREILALAGYVVEVEHDGLHALERARSDGFVLRAALLDVRMPGMGGIALHRALLAEHPSACYVLTSGYPPPGQIELALGQGAQLLEKPVDPAELLALLRSCCPVE